MNFLHKPLTWKFCLGATLFFAALYVGSWLLPKGYPGIDVRIPAIEFLGLGSAAFALVFLGATLSFLIADGSDAVSPPPPLWTRFVGLLYFALMAILMVIGPVTGRPGPWLISPLGDLFRELLVFFLAASVPLTTFACAVAGRPSATRWDKVCWCVNALWIALAFFVLVFGAGLSPG